MRLKCLSKERDVTISMPFIFASIRSCYVASAPLATALSDIDDERRAVVLMRSAYVPAQTLTSNGEDTCDAFPHLSLVFVTGTPGECGLLAASR